MALPPQKFRELVLQLMYSRDAELWDRQALVPMMMQELSVTRKSVLQAMDRVEEIFSHAPEMDAQLASICQDYSFERIQRVERNILRLGSFEVLHDSAIPPKVAISEAIRLSRKFATREGAAFVNALLDQVWHQSQGEPIDSEQVVLAARDLEEAERLSEEAAQSDPQQE